MRNSKDKTPKNCKYCNSEFVPQHRSDQKFCSIQCGKKYHESNKTKILVVKQCKYCQNEFYSRRKFCSTECKDEWHKKQKRIANEEKHKRNPIQCRGCGEEFIPYRDDQIWCSSQCKTNAHAEEQKEARSAIRESTTRVCPICNKEFSPKRSMREKYCSPRCRNLFPKKIYKALRTCLQYTDQKKQDRTHKLLGYTPRQLQEHIQSHPNWDKVKDGDWHLDHIFPIIAFLENDIKDISLICCLENLQPLSGKANCRKNGSYDQKEFLDWLGNMR